MPNRPSRVYIHLPFCSGKCHYCDFQSGPATGQIIESYLEALLGELRHRLGREGQPLRSLYFGGGTPSLIGADKLGRILDGVMRQTDLADDCELSLEVNPETPSLKLKAILDLPFNRISLGCQCLDDKVLAVIGRRHRLYDIERSLDLVFSRKSNVSLDFILGLPGQTETMVEATLLFLDRFPAQHVSLYMLDLDETKSRVEWVRDLPDFAQVAGWYSNSVVALEEAGYRQYEISNFAREGFCCAHNLAYWNYEPYLGLGSSAVSFFPSFRPADQGKEGNWQRASFCRIKNVLTPEEYIERITSRLSPAGSIEFVREEQALFEYIFLQLRQRSGILPQTLSDLFAIDVKVRFGSRFARWIGEGILEFVAGRYRFTRVGLFRANSVYCDFLDYDDSAGLMP